MKIKVREVSPVFRLLDCLLTPVMWVLCGFRFPLQETHPWHVQDVDGRVLIGKIRLKIYATNQNSKFGHDSPFGLFHMPIFGGLKNIVIVKPQSYEKFWHIGWADKSHAQVNKLRIYNHKLALLTPKKGYFEAFGVDSTGKLLELSLVGKGKIGDSKISRVRLL